jgi:TonB family protein
MQESTRGGVSEPGVGRVKGFGGAIPSGGPGGGRGGQVNGGLEILTPTEGVDFSNYLDRVLASVRRNWYAVIPESARMGEKGMVVLQFRIMRDGNVPSPEPNMAASSGKEPLDRAAYSAIRSSSPFEPLPSAFSGPFIELRFYFLYNLPVEYATGK